MSRPILIEAYTRERLPASIQVHPLGEIRLKGKTLPVHIYSIDVAG